MPDFLEGLFENDQKVNDIRQAWTIETTHQALETSGRQVSKRTVERDLLAQNLIPAALSLENLSDENARPVKQWVAEALVQEARTHRDLSLFVQLHTTPSGQTLIAGNDGRNARRWIFLESDTPTDEALLCALQLLCGEDKDRVLLWPDGNLCARLRALADPEQRIAHTLRTALAAYHPADVNSPMGPLSKGGHGRDGSLSHLDRLEAEAIHIMREVVATADNPVMLYSVGKDSSVMLHLARKAFYPAPPPFPLLHVNTGWKFQEMIRFRDRMAEASGMKLITHLNPEGLARNINPIDHGSSVHTDIMKTQGLRQALNEHRFDAAFGGARRDEEKSRAKERIFSFRSATHRWDPKNQRPELWNLYNTSIKKGESIRVFPISNWTELDIWQYIHLQQIPIVPLYFAARRPFVERDGMLIMLDDDRMAPNPGEQIHFEKIRFRTLGCYPLTGALRSDADDLDSVILELLQSRSSERQGRAIDSDQGASMEKKKQEGYF